MTPEFREHSDLHLIVGMLRLTSAFATTEVSVVTSPRLKVPCVGGRKDRKYAFPRPNRRYTTVRPQRCREAGTEVQQDVLDLQFLAICLQELLSFRL